MGATEMQRVGFEYIVKAVLEFPREEIEFLRDSALTHYDAVCQGTAIPGHGAFLHGALVCRDGELLIKVSWTWRELDLCLKILEMAPFASMAHADEAEKLSLVWTLQQAFRQALQEMTIESNQLNTDHSG